MFFVSFVVLVAWTLLQVVVAVLLDNFTAAADQEKQRKVLCLSCICMCPWSCCLFIGRVRVSAPCSLKRCLLTSISLKKRLKTKDERPWCTRSILSWPRWRTSTLVRTSGKISATTLPRLQSQTLTPQRPAANESSSCFLCLTLTIRAACPFANSSSACAS